MEKDKSAKDAVNSGTLSTREFYNISTDSPGCGTCHYEDINPLGFAMEDIDGLGRYRTSQIAIGTETDANGGTSINIDAMGALWDPEVAEYTNHVTEIPVNGSRELSLALANTNSIQTCLIEKAFRLTINRPLNLAARDLWNTASDRALSDLESESYACAQSTLSKALQSSQQNPKALFESMGKLDLLRFRR